MTRSPGASRRKERIEFALVGAGNLAKWEHLPNIKKLSGVGLRAVYSAAGVRGKSYALRFGAAYACSEYEEVLRDAEVDAVLIASRNQHHAAQSLAALRAGKHVFVEKPMALTAEECSELCAAVEESGKQLTVGFNRRFAPFYRELKENLERRNSPAVVQCRINSPGISGSYWMADPAIGGAILGEACHFIDLMYWLLDSEPVSVSAYSPADGEGGSDRREQSGGIVPLRRWIDRQSDVLHGGQQDVGRGAGGGVRAGRGRDSPKISSAWACTRVCVRRVRGCGPIRAMPGRWPISRRAYGRAGRRR